jgi:hypothetical protein
MKYQPFRPFESGTGFFKQSRLPVSRPEGESRVFVPPLTLHTDKRFIIFMSVVLMRAICMTNRL